MYTTHFWHRVHLVTSIDMMFLVISLYMVIYYGCELWIFVRLGGDLKINALTRLVKSYPRFHGHGAHT